MEKILKPMLAGKCEDVKTLKYPVLCTTKLDGIRCLKIEGKCLSRTFKPIPNHFIRTWIEKNLPDGLDGELIMEGKTFQETTGDVMRESGEPNFTYFIFDYVKDALDRPYSERMADLEALKLPAEHIKRVLPVEIKNVEELQELEEKYISEGYEGVMIRKPEGPYKLGRSTAKEGLLLKLKRFEDDEATIVAINEKMHNENAADKDAFGRTKRSTAKAGMVPAGTMGELVVTCKKFKNQFGIGSGFDDATRAELWKNKKSYIGKVVKFKHQPSGAAEEAPRFPVFLGLRDKIDM